MDYYRVIRELDPLKVWGRRLTDKQKARVKELEAARRGGGDHDDGDALRDRLHGDRFGLPQAQGRAMTRDRTITIVLAIYVGLIFVFVFAPIIFSLIFSFNSQRFPTIPLGEFSTESRQLVPLHEIPLHLQKAFLATEDRTFYRHKGVQPLLDDIIDFLPSPLDVPPVQGL